MQSPQHFALQCYQSLHWQNLLELTLKYLQMHFEIKGLGYQHQHETHDLEYFTGSSCDHAHCYHLYYEQQDLGHLQIFTEQPLILTQLRELEMICSLLSPALAKALQFLQLQYHATHDPLTGVANRSLFSTMLQREIDLAARHGQSCLLLMVDIDHFKQINDQFGHLQGDIVLQKTAQTLKNQLRKSDQLFRFGGEEFVAILSQTHNDAAAMIGQRIIEAVAKQQFSASSENFRITASAGLTPYQPDDNVHELLQRADTALHQAKQAGKNRFVIL